MEKLKKEYAKVLDLYSRGLLSKAECIEKTEKIEDLMLEKEIEEGVE